MSDRRPALNPIRVSGTSRGHTRLDIVAGRRQQFSLITDEPPERGGNDDGMLPLEAFMAGYASCTHVIMNMIAQEMAIHFDDITINVTGYLDPRGYLGSEKLDTPFVKVDMAISGEVSGAIANLEALKSQLAWRCPAAATLKAAGVTLNNRWTLAEKS